MWGHEDIPDEVQRRMGEEPRKPKLDPTLGVAVPAPVPDAGDPPPNRLVTIGDSLTHGFRSGAIYDTQNAYPVLIAKALGIEDSFRYPRYGFPDSFGGIPLNIEWLMRGLQAGAAGQHGIAEAAELTRAAHALLEQHDDYWERGDGTWFPEPPGAINHNLAVYGFDIRDALARTAEQCLDELGPAHDTPFDPLPENANQIATLRVLNTARDAAGKPLSQLGAAATLGAQGGGPHGIETLIVFLGANNALQSVVALRVAWSGKHFQDPKKKNRYTVWTPTHFRTELDDLVAHVREIRARHVLWLTVPHVTIAPIAKGVGAFLGPKSAYYEHYVRPWVTDTTPHILPHIDGREAQAVDKAIDMYNEAIEAQVRRARADGLDWALVDIAGTLDRLAYKRYLARPQATPSWWKEVGGQYRLPDALLQALGLEANPPDTRFLTYKDGKVDEGGLVGLDGVHPTCTGYSIVAAECIRVMAGLGVKFPNAAIDYAEVAAADTLCTQPIASLGGDMRFLHDLDSHLNLLGLLERASRLFG